MVLLLNQFLSESVLQYCVVALQKLRAKYIIHPRPTELATDAVALTKKDVMAKVARLLEACPKQLMEPVAETFSDNVHPKLGVVLLTSSDRAYQQSFYDLW